MIAVGCDARSYFPAMKAIEYMRWIVVFVLVSAGLALTFATTTRSNDGGLVISTAVFGLAVSGLIFFPARQLYQRKYEALLITISAYAAVAVYFSLRGLMDWKNVDSRLRGAWDAGIHTDDVILN